MSPDCNLGFTTLEWIMLLIGCWDGITTVPIILITYFFQRTNKSNAIDELSFYHTLIKKEVKIYNNFTQDETNYGFIVNKVFQGSNTSIQRTIYFKTTNDLENRDLENK